VAAYVCMPLFFKLLAPIVGQLTKIIPTVILSYNEIGLWDNLSGVSEFCGTS